MYKLMSALIAGLALSACMAPAKYVKTEQVVIVQEESAKGLQTVVKKIERLAEKNVIEKSTNVKSVSRLTDFKGSKLPGKIDVSPDGDKILVELYESGKGQDSYTSNLWTIKNDGTALTKVTQGKYMDLDPVFSPDAKYVYFSSNRGEIRPKLWRVYASGVGGLTRITSSNTSDRMPSVTPTGQDIAYQSLLPETNDWQIWSVNKNGALPTQLLTGITPSFSPDGSKILYSAYNADAKKYDVWVMNVDGTNRTQLTTGDSDCFNPRWSQDGSQILYSSNKGLDEERQNNFDIWLMNNDGTNNTQLTTNGSQDDLPVFDPKNRFIYFRSNRGGNWDIWRMELALN